MKQMSHPILIAALGATSSRRLSLRLHRTRATRILASMLRPSWPWNWRSLSSRLLSSQASSGAESASYGATTSPYVISSVSALSGLHGREKDAVQTLCAPSPEQPGLPPSHGRLWPIGLVGPLHRAVLRQIRLHRRSCHIQHTCTLSRSSRGRRFLSLRRTCRCRDLATVEGVAVALGQWTGTMEGRDD